MSASALRFYEKERLIARPLRVSGRRDYDERVFLDLNLIRMALESGFSIREARTLLYGFTESTRPRERWRALTARKLPDIRQRIEELHHAEAILRRATVCECNSLAECANKVVSR